jgi:membrane dipeptidase
MTDQMIKALAAKGGVIQINYGVGFPRSTTMPKWSPRNPGCAPRVPRNSKSAAAMERAKAVTSAKADASCVATSRRGDSHALIMTRSSTISTTQWSALITSDSVQISTGHFVPFGMEDCSKLPKITEALMRKGYSDANIRKILGGNLLRVMEQNEKVSHELQAQ